MVRHLTRGTLLLLLLACISSPLLAGIEAEKVEPADGETVSRPPRNLRVWFTQAPDVTASELELRGPDGELELEGLHTMGEKDLMVRIVGRVADGEYTAHWRTTDAGGSEHEGTWSFTVKRGGA